MSNFIKQIEVESAYTKSHTTIQHLIDDRDERTRLWEKKINEYICNIKRSDTSGHVDGRQACGQNDSGNSAITIHGSSYY